LQVRILPGIFHERRRHRGNVLLNRITVPIVTVVLGFPLFAVPALSPGSEIDTTRTSKMVGASSLRGKVLCGYQGWFRCPGDPSRLGWIHWSFDSRRITPESVSFEMWPDLAEYTPSERFAAPGFAYPDGRQAELFSSDNATTVLRHFEWLRSYGIDGVWLQHFVVDLPGAPAAGRYPSRLRVLEHVRAAAAKTGRVWALSYDVSGMPEDRVYDVLTRNWRALVDAGVTRDPRYLHENGRAVVEVWGFYHNNPSNRMTVGLGNRLIDFFTAPGPYRAFLVGGGDWAWRRNRDPAWQTMLRRFNGYSPWNVGNYWTDAEGLRHATTNYWVEDREECQRLGILWLPVVYPGFSWKNLKRHAPGLTTIPRRRGEFLWEQFHELARLKVREATVAMFDEVDEGTAIFKITSAPPQQAEFVGLEGLPSDWYLRLVGEGIKMLSGRRPISKRIPIRPN
jgi:hypothetical protein